MNKSTNPIKALNLSDISVKRNIESSKKQPIPHLTLEGKGVTKTVNWTGT